MTAMVRFGGFLSKKKNPDALSAPQSGFPRCNHFISSQLLRVLAPSSLRNPALPLRRPHVHNNRGSSLSLCTATVRIQDGLAGCISNPNRQRKTNMSQNDGGLAMMTTSHHQGGAIPGSPGTVHASVLLLLSAFCNWDSAPLPHLQLRSGIGETRSEYPLGVARWLLFF